MNVSAPFGVTSWTASSHVCSRTGINSSFVAFTSLNSKLRHEDAINFNAINNMSNQIPVAMSWVLHNKPKQKCCCSLLRCRLPFETWVSLNIRLEENKHFKGRNVTTEKRQLLLFESCLTLYCIVLYAFAFWLQERLSTFLCSVITKGLLPSRWTGPY